MQGVHAYEDFFASHDHMPGSGGTLRVTGTVVFATSGWSCSLRATEGNTGINPMLLSLDLLLTEPPPGTAVAQVLTPCPVEWSVEDPAIEYQQVQFRVLRVQVSDEEPPPILDVAHPE
jgi:hypothetical protein